MNKKYSLSVIMPALNEEKNIEDAIIATQNAFNKYEINGEIIIVNDGSSDNTAFIVQEISKKFNNIRTITHEKPEGVGRSVWDGFNASQKDVVVMFPADNENDPDESLLYFDLMNKVDIIAPFICNINVRGKKRKIISEIYNFIVNSTFGTKLNYHNGTTFYRRAILNDVKLKSFGFFFQTELIVKLVKKDYLFAEVPSYLSIRSGGNSKALTRKSFINVAKGYLNLVYSVYIKNNFYQKNNKNFNPESVTYLRNLEFENKFKNNRGEYASIK